MRWVWTTGLKKLKQHRILNNMKTKLLKKLREDAKRYIYLCPCGFEESYNQHFSHDITPVEIHTACTSELMEKYETDKDYAEVDGVEFVYMCLCGPVLSWGWSGTCRLDKAKKILKTLRREYILQECECIREERLFKNNEKEYRNFKKYLESL